MSLRCACVDLCSDGVDVVSVVDKSTERKVSNEILDDGNCTTIQV